MIFSRAWGALMRRNAIYRRRNWIGTFLELALPTFFVWILVAIKNADDSSGGLASKEIPAIIPQNEFAFTPLTFRDYLTAMQAARRCIADRKTRRGFDHPFRITGIADKGFNWQVPLVKCDSRKCEFDGQDAMPFCEFGSIGLSASSLDDIDGATRVLDFRDWLHERYSILAAHHNETGASLPFHHEFVQIFQSPDDMDAYVMSKEYGSQFSPKIVMGIVFEGNDPKNYIYSLRQNSTNFNSPEEAAFLTWTTPDTSRLLKSYARNDHEVCVMEPGAPRIGQFRNSCTRQYMFNGVLTFQRLVGDYILDRTGAQASGYGVAEAGVQFVQFPTKPYTKSGFYKSIEDIGPLMVMLGLLYPVANMIGFIVSEKELRQKELMKMMSVTESDIGWSWFVSFLITDIISAIATTAMSTQLYENSEAMYLSIFWVLTFIAVTVFASTVATLSSKTIRGILIGLLLFFIGIFLTIAIPINYREDDGTLVRLISLHLVAAFSYGLQEIGRLEDQGTGLQRFTIDFTDNPSGFTFITAIENLLISSVLWGAMAWYLNRVIEPDYGQALPLWFPFQPSYWMPGRYSQAPREDTFSSDEAERNNDNIPMEPVSGALKLQTKKGESIEIKGLRKQFGENTAVDGLTLSMYSGQVTALLGHNGAGKTSTINILTGAMAPTDGYATVRGLNIRTELPKIRENLGICLQDDCLFPTMSVREHVQFYARLKGMYSKVSHREAESLVDEAIADVALSDKRNTLAKNLSGGMKRKLSLAIAFCGGSRVVLLDEPTSGCDVFARRFIWNLIRRYRQNRCIVLTTHFMDEADVLGDRIAIMAQGRLQCLGSSLFLKKTFGVGYHLTIEKQKAHGKDGVKEAVSSDHLKPSRIDESSSLPGDDSGQIGGARTVPRATSDKKELGLINEVEVGALSSQESGSDDAALRNSLAGGQDSGGMYSDELEGDNSSEACEVQHKELGGDTCSETISNRLRRIIASAVKDGKLLSDAGSEMSFQLPMESSGGFSLMFEALDCEVAQGSISCYGISLTTLDEVFLRVARDEASCKTSSSSKQRMNVSSQETNTRGVRSPMDLDNDILFLRHLGALFRKRAAFFRRDKKAWICTSILPSLFVCIGFLVFTYAAPDRNLDPLMLDLDDYNPKASEPRNPIQFNRPQSVFSCQPGHCVYQEPVVVEQDTSELYFFCGFQGRILDLNSIASDTSFLSKLTKNIEKVIAKMKPISNCTITETSNILSRITDDGASPQPVDIESISEASLSLSVSEGSYAATQYGAIYFTHDGQSTLDDEQSSSYSETVVATCRSRPANYTSVDTCGNFAQLGYVIQYNFTALHVAPLYQTLADEALVREAKDDEEYRIQATIAPLPFTKLEQGLGEGEDGFAAWFLVVLSFPFISGNYASFIVKERQSKAKHLQTVSGVKPAAYWLSTYMWDILNYQIPLWIVVTLMFAFNVNVLTTLERGVFPGILTVLILYGFASPGFTYVCTFAFDSPSLCNMFMVIFGFLIGMGGPMACLILILLGKNDPTGEKENLLDVARILTWVLRFTPSFGLGKALFNAINIDLILFLDGNMDATAWSEPILLYETVFLACQSVFFICLAMQLDIWSSNPHAVLFWRRLLFYVTLRFLWDKGDQSSPVALADDDDDDDDVVREENRVLSGQASGDLVVSSQVKKVYDTGKVAVNDISLGIPAGECFGLLGINGAGKTTMMGMLTAEFPPTTGDITLAGFSVTHEPHRTRRILGYCPQYDAHFSKLTGREHVELYASIKGIKKEYIEAAVTAKLHDVGLSEADSDRLSSRYSGGMKRRLSLACATIGQPQIVFLDECSTGVDPVARHEIWTLVSDMVAKDRTSVILTTHSMAECQSLCSRIGIMANGRLRCLGSAQHLKSKFGMGYQVELKIRLFDKGDDNYITNKRALVGSKQVGPEDDKNDNSTEEEIFFNLTETVAALRTLTGDNSLSDTICAEDATGYDIWKDATSSVGVAVENLASFASSELCMRKVELFVRQHFPGSQLRERQGRKVRYEVSREGLKVSTIFATIEAHKDELFLADYGVSQTSLEQVFNFHAAEAEALKVGRVDR